MIKHIVLLRFLDATSTAQIAECEAQFQALKTTVHSVLDLRWGTNVSPEGLNKGFTHCFELSFADASSRDAYLVHPMHQQFAQEIKASLDDVLVIDYECN
jgi:hypothetical protein